MSITVNNLEIKKSENICLANVEWTNIKNYKRENLTSVNNKMRLTKYKYYRQYPVSYH